MSTPLPTANPPPLGQGVAYGLVVGFGLAFALLVNGLVLINRRYNFEARDVLQFLTARKSVRTGLVASGVCSSWIYVSTLLNSARLVYFYGFSVVWWFAFATTIQIVAYAILAIELKRKAPRANTSVEVVRIRFGRAAHFTMLFFGLSVQLLVTVSLLLGATAAITAITGASTVAMNWLAPLGVVIYSLIGGIKATFVADWAHTVIIFAVTLFLFFRTMAVESVPVVGSPGKVWELLMNAEGGAIGAYRGSYLTMDSGQGLLLAGILIVTGMTAVYVDPSYGQKAIAGKATAVVKGYFIGGMAYAAIPLALSSTVAYVAITLQATQYWPQPGGLTVKQANDGLMLPLAAQAIAGKGGAIAVLLMVFEDFFPSLVSRLQVFMALTSSASNEFITAASVYTFDIYKAYVRPTASEKSLRWVSHLSLVGYAILTAAFATGLNYGDVSMSWLLEAMGVFLGSGVVPIILALTSARVPAWYMASAPWIGMACGLAAWFAITKERLGVINLTTTLDNWSMFTGNIVSITIPAIIWAVQWPFNKRPYNWMDLFIMKPVSPRMTDVVYAEGDISDLGSDWEPRQLKSATRLAAILSISFTIIFLIVIPFPMYGTHYIMSKKFFTGLTVIVFIFTFVAALTIALLPLLEAKSHVVRAVKGMYAEARGRPISTNSNDQAVPIEALTSEKKDKDGSDSA